MPVITAPTADNAIIAAEACDVAEHFVRADVVTVVERRVSPGVAVIDKRGLIEEGS